MPDLGYGLGSMRVVSMLGLLVALAGCFEEGRACYPGDYSACECDSGEPGYAQCDAEGNVYGACGFCGTTPGAAPVGGGNEGGGRGFLEACETNDQCDTELCHVFQAKGMFCSQPCEGPEDCPAPSSGCNGMGICKAP